MKKGLFACFAALALACMSSVSFAAPAADSPVLQAHVATCDVAAPADTSATPVASAFSVAEVKLAIAPGESSCTTARADLTDTPTAIGTSAETVGSIRHGVAAIEIATCAT